MPSFPHDTYHDLTFRPAHYSQSPDGSGGVVFTVNNNTNTALSVGHPPGGAAPWAPVDPHGENCGDDFFKLSAGDTITISTDGTITISKPPVP